MNTPAVSVEREPLYRIQKRALTDVLARLECAHRYVREHHADKTHRFQVSVGGSYLRGLLGERDLYAHGRGGNFAASFRRAYRAGAELRRELLIERGQ